MFKSTDNSRSLKRLRSFRLVARNCEVLRLESFLDFENNRSPNPDTVIIEAHSESRTIVIVEGTEYGEL